MYLSKSLSKTLNLRQKAYRPFCGTEANSADPDQTPQNVASDQGLHYLLAERYYIKI